MKILFFTPNFYPKVGGLEIVADMLAGGLAYEMNTEVRLVTLTPLGEHQELTVPYELIRINNAWALWKEIKWCDIFVHHGLSLKAVFPLILYPRKWFVIHHLPYIQAGKNHSLQYIKQFLTKFCRNISVSSYVKNSIKNRGIVIYNPYNDALFRNFNLKREYDLLYVGRLVSDKGVAILLKSLFLLKQNGLTIKLNIIGEGPEKSNLIALINKYEIKSQVILLGERSQEETAELMNRHKILIIPSKWDEPFGIIALEGLASGCDVIASNGGGLPEAIYPLGLLFKKNDSLNLANQIKKTLASSNLNKSEEVLIEKLKKHHIEHVSKLYLNAFYN